MTRPRWAVTATLDGPVDDDELVGRLVEALGAPARSGPGRITIDYTVEAAIIAAAQQKALTVLTAAGIPAGWSIVGIEVLTEEIADERLEEPRVPPLVGITETAEILGVSRQRAHALTRTPTFPRPVAELASGPVYIESAVRGFAETPRRGGRPGGRLAQIEVRDERGRGCLVNVRGTVTGTKTHWTFTGHPDAAAMRAIARTIATYGPEVRGLLDDQPGVIAKASLGDDGDLVLEGLGPIGASSHE